MLNNDTAATITTGRFFLCTVVALLLGAVIAITFGYKSNKSKGFLMTLGVMPCIVEIIIILVNGNLGTGVAAMGAFSLVRFRSVPGNAKDICGIFLAMAIGLALGTNHILLAIIFTLIICAVVIVSGLDFFKFFKLNENTERELTIVIPESLDYTEVFNDIMNKYTFSWELVQVKTTNMGSLFKLKYYITLKDAYCEKRFIDELRCRNGNLEIICGRKMMDSLEQL